MWEWPTQREIRSQTIIPLKLFFLSATAVAGLVVKNKADSTAQTEKRNLLRRGVQPFAIADRITFTDMKYGRQWVRVIFMRYV